MESRRVEAKDFSSSYQTIVVPRRMRVLLRMRRRRDLLAAFQRIAAEEQLGLGIQEAAITQLQEVAKLLSPQRLDRDAERIAMFNRRRAWDRAQVRKEQKRSRALPAPTEASIPEIDLPADPSTRLAPELPGSEAVVERLEVVAAEVEREACRGFYTTAVGRALAIAVRESRNGSVVPA